MAQAVAAEALVAALPPMAVQGTKKALANAMRARATEVLDIGFAQAALACRSDDFREAHASRQEQRPALYTGR